MGIRLLDSMCLKVGENLYVFLGLIYDRSGRILIESIAFGSRRDLIAVERYDPIGK